MIDVSERIRIDAPVEAVFGYTDRPETRPEITPSLTRSETLEERPDGSNRVAYTNTMAGVDLDGRLEAGEYDPERRVTWETTGDLTGTIGWEFEADDGGTLVTYTGRYEIPASVPERIVDPFVRRYTERELRTTLGILRTRLE
jgi:uncharacterized membrane protein